MQRCKGTKGYGHIGSDLLAVTEKGDLTGIKVYPSIVLVAQLADLLHLTSERTLTRLLQLKGLHRGHIETYCVHFSIARKDD